MNFESSLRFQSCFSSVGERSYKRWQIKHRCSKLKVQQQYHPALPITFALKCILGSDAALTNAVFSKIISIYKNKMSQNFYHWFFFLKNNDTQLLWIFFPWQWLISDIALVSWIFFKWVINLKDPIHSSKISLKFFNGH